MPAVPVSQVKPGDKLIEDVLTPLGGTLFHKGKIVNSRELDILRAFFVAEVVVDGVISENEQQGSVAEEEAQPFHSFKFSGLQDAYDQMIKLMKKVYQQFTTGQPLPILEIRTQLERLLAHSKEYNLLTFSTRMTRESEYIYHNSLLTALTSYQLAQWVNFAKKDWVQVALAGLLHDIGNVKIDKDLISKPSALTAAEIEEMKRHTVYGYQLLKNVPALNEGVKLCALQHHEKLDGSGYPLGVKGDKIHPYARIVAIADIYHAMTLKRTYRDAISPYKVLEQLQQESFGKLDPVYVQVLVEKATQFHNGTIVRLSDGRIGEIVFSDRNHVTRPWVSINGTIVNLTTERHLHIQEII